MKINIVFPVLLLCICSAASAEILPDQVDLKAAYCIPIARSSSNATVRENLPERIKNSLRENKERNEVNLRRLNLYLLPRIPYLDSMALIGASRSAEDDLARIAAEVGACFKKSEVEAMTCLNVNTEAAVRVRSCNNLSFLPF